MANDGRTELRPVICLTKRASGRYEGYEIQFIRINEHGERAAGTTVIAELDLDDLRTLHDALGHYLDEGRYQE